MGFRLFWGLVFLVSYNFYAQHFNSINFPAYVGKNSNFQISFNGAFNEDQYDNVYLYLIIDDNIRLLKAQLTTGKDYANLPITYEKNSYGNVNKITLEHNTLSKLKNSPFQLLVSFKNGLEPVISIKYVWGALQGKKRILFNSSFVESKNNNVPQKINIVSVEKGDKAGNLLAIKKNGYFKVPVENIQDIVLIEFWAKNNSIGSKILLNNNAGKEIFSVELADFYFLHFDKHSEELFYDEFFIDKYQWNYYALAIDKLDRKIKFYVNENKFFSFNFNEIYDENSINLLIDNTNGNGLIEIDRFRIYQLKEKIENIFNGKFYVSNYAENGRLIVSYDFDETGLNRLTGKNNFKYYNCELYTSTAPIFSDLPELSVEVFNGFYSVKWQSNDEKFKTYFLERSENGSDFYEIYKVESNGVENEQFVFTDYKTTKSKALFYRLKQINKSGKIIYSNIIKVGIVAKELFELKPNFPNPFNPSTEITLVMLEDSDVEIKIYDITGKEIEILYKGQLNKGTHIFKFNGSEYPSGIYLCKVESGQTLKVQKMILTK
jgi:hypothetical protein